MFPKGRHYSTLLPIGTLPNPPPGAPKSHEFTYDKRGRQIRFVAHDEDGKIRLDATTEYEDGMKITEKINCWGANNIITEYKYDKAGKQIYCAQRNDFGERTFTKVTEYKHELKRKETTDYHDGRVFTEDFKPDGTLRRHTVRKLDGSSIVSSCLDLNKPAIITFFGPDGKYLCHTEYKVNRYDRTRIECYADGSIEEYDWRNEIVKRKPGKGV